MSPWDRDPFRVISMNGSLVTAQRSSPKNQCITRNSSFFKIHLGLELDESSNTERTIENEANETPGVLESDKTPKGLDGKTQNDSVGEQETPAQTGYIQKMMSSGPPRGVGRQSAAESAKIENERQVLLAAKANPATRVSARLKGLPAQTIAMLVEGGGRYYVAVETPIS